MSKQTVFMVSAAKYLLKEKRFLLTSVGVFAVFSLFTAPLFSMITSTLAFIQVVDDDNPYYLLRQAFASEAGEEVTEEEATGEVVEEPLPTTEPPPTTTAPPPTTEEPQPLTAQAQWDSTDGNTAPATFLFEADAEGGTEPYTFHWEFGDGQQATGRNIEHTYEDPGTYTATLTVTDTTGQTASDTTSSIQVIPAPTTTGQPPTTNATALPQPINQTNQTAASPTPPFEPPRCIIIDNMQYCLLPPNAPEPKGVVCVAVDFRNGTGGLYCPTGSSIIQPLEPDTTNETAAGQPLPLNQTIIEDWFKYIIQNNMDKIISTINTSTGTNETREICKILVDANNELASQNVTGDQSIARLDPAGCNQDLPPDYGSPADDICSDYAKGVYEGFFRESPEETGKRHGAQLRALGEAFSDWLDEGGVCECPPNAEINPDTGKCVCSEGYVDVSHSVQPPPGYVICHKFGSGGTQIK